MTGVVEPEVDDHGLEVGVHRQRAEVAERRELHPDVVGGGAEHQAQEGGRRALVHRPVMPKSSSAIRPSGITKRLPPWRSPWKTPSMSAPSMKPIIAGAHDALGVDAGVPACDATSSKLKPSRRSITSTRSGDERGVGPRDDVPVAGRGRRSSLATSSMFCGLEPEVELLGDGLGEQLDQRRRVGQRGERDATDEERCEPRHHPEVLAHELRDGGALHLHHDLLAGVERGGVDLGDRRGGERGRRSKRRRRPRAGAEILLDGGPHVVEGLGRHLVAALLELLDQLLGEEALAGGDDLAELDVGGAEVSAAMRSRRERSARLASASANFPRRFLIIHGAIALPRCATTVMTRRPAAVCGGR